MESSAASDVYKRQMRRREADEEHELDEALLIRTIPGMSIMSCLSIQCPIRVVPCLGKYEISPIFNIGMDAVTYVPCPIRAVHTIFWHV